MIAASALREPSPALLPEGCRRCTTGQETRTHIKAVLAQLVARTLEGERERMVPVLTELGGACRAALQRCLRDGPDRDRRLIRRLERAIAVAEGGR